MAAKTKKTSAKERLFQKQDEAAVKLATKKLKVNKVTKTLSKDEKIAKLKEQARRAAAAAAAAQRAVLVAENPKLEGLQKRLEEATKIANKHPRLIKLRQNKIATAKEALEKLVTSLSDMLQRQKEDDAIVAKLTAELDQARLDMFES